ncbi:MAG: HlyD family efflux transporter periplasmic adaptor subunit [Planctomycetota bacterium]
MHAISNMVRSFIRANSGIWVFWPSLVAPSLFLLGCGGQDEGVIERRPRPVSVQTLRIQRSPDAALVAASAAAWKKEDLGFEVGGRVESVVDQNAEIDGRARDQENNLIFEGTPIAHLETERYELAVASAKAEVARAEQDLVVAKTDLKETIPAKIASASASAELAKVEYERNQRLMQQGAGSQSDLDAAKANLESAMAELKQLAASEKSQQAQIDSLENGVLQAKQKLRDAERDLEDCTLYSSFSGQVADVSVVPGSLVGAGDPVATVQMMDPIMIELEVSADQSRKLQRTEVLPVHVTMPDGSIQVHNGFLHQIDPAADPLTRTFTLTVLVLNQAMLPEEVSTVATTDDIWRLDLKFIPGAEEGDLFVEEEAIDTDDQGDFLWKVTNSTIQERNPEDSVFEVKKMRIQASDVQIPYLGEYVFRKITVDDPSFEPSSNFVLGKIRFTGDGESQWDSKRVTLQTTKRWMLRPGDLVKIDLAGRSEAEGFYVPMDAISVKGDDSSIFLIDQSDGETIARRQPVAVVNDTTGVRLSSMRRIVPPDDASLEGRQYITAGTHFLIDGEPVSIVTADVETGQAVSVDASESTGDEVSL